MSNSEENLRAVIRESISRRRKITLSSGKRVDEGSKHHLQEMDRLVMELDYLRKGMGRSFRKERYTVSRCIESIRFMKNKLRRQGIRSGLLSEND